MIMPIYFDNHSTTPLDPQVFEAMRPYFTEKFSNPSSPHVSGWEIESQVKLCREKILTLFEAQGYQVIFTSGATESNNLAIQGIVEASGLKKAHVITQATEHSCILESCKKIISAGHEVTFLPVDHEGFVSPLQIKEAIRANTVLVSIMAANNEIGTIQPIDEISKICRDKKILFHTDAVQAIGRMNLSAKDIGWDLLSLSAHKIYGPKGIGALVSRTKKIKPLLVGGGQEEGLRSGTLNVPGIIGLTESLDLMMKNQASETSTISKLRTKFWNELKKMIPLSFLMGTDNFSRRLAQNLSVRFLGVDAGQLLALCPDLCLSTGSACSSQNGSISHVIQSLGVNEQISKEVIRIGLGRFTTESEIDRGVTSLAKAVFKLRENSPVYEMEVKKRGML